MRRGMIKLSELSENVYHRLERRYKFQGHLSYDKEIELENAVGYSAYLDGFWTSTVYKDKSKFLTKWIEIVRNELTYGPLPTNDSEGYFHLYTIIDNPKIRHLGSGREVEKFLDKYQEGEKKSDIMWNKISEEFDAVHLFEDGLDTPIFRHWDVESTIWFRPEKYLKEQFVWKMNEK